MRRALLLAIIVPMASACALIVGLKDRELADGGLDSGSDALGDAADAGCVGSTIQTDPLNCGRCGHDCFGGACDGGECQPKTIATSTTGSTIYAVALDELGTTVFWASSDAIESSASDGTSVTSLHSLDGGPTTSMVEAQGKVYWAEPGKSGPGSVSVNGSSFTLVEGFNNDPYQVLVAGNQLYWPDNTSGKQVRSCTLGTCTPSNAFDVTTGLGAGSTAIAIDDTTLYVNHENSDVGIAFCDLKTCAQAGVVRMGINARVDAIAADDAGVYFTDDAGTVASCPPRTSCIDAGGPKIFLSQEPNAEHIVLDHANGERRLYWINAGSALRTCVLPGCNDVRSLATGPIHGLALTAEAVYFGSTNTVMRVAKP